MRKLAVLMVVVLLGAAFVVAEVPDNKADSPGPSNVNGSPRATGGPDDYGYIYADNAEAACSALYSYVDITSTGTAAGLAGVDDDYAGPFPMGFTFPFYAFNETEFYVGTNGTVYFMDDYLGLGNVCPLPATQPYNPQTFIAVYHDDLIVQSDGDIYYQTFASCPVGSGGQCTVIQFFNVRAYGGADGDDMDFEAVLFDDGSVVELYNQPANSSGSQTNGGSATAGIQGTDVSPPAYGIDYSCNSPSLSSGLAVAFAPPDSITGGVPNVCAQQPSPTPSGPQPIPTASKTGLLVLAGLMALVAIVLIRRRFA